MKNKTVTFSIYARKISGTDTTGQICFTFCNSTTTNNTDRHRWKLISMSKENSESLNSWTRLTATATITEKFLTSGTDAIDENGYLRVMLYANTLNVYEFKDFQLEFGNEATDYEPYKSNTLTISEPLRGIKTIDSNANYVDMDGIKWYADELKIHSDGTGSLIRYTDYAEFDADFKFLSVFEGHNLFYTDGKIKPSNNSNRDCMCNLAYGIRNYSKTMDDLECRIRNDGRFYINDDRFDNAEDFNAAYKDKKFKVLASLETPTIEYLTKDQVSSILQTYSPTTIITNDSGAEMDIEYIQDAYTYINDLKSN